MKLLLGLTRKQGSIPLIPREESQIHMSSTLQPESIMHRNHKLTFERQSVHELKS